MVVVVTVMDESLCLCLFFFFRREVRLSSRGFMSGGTFTIFLNMITRKKSKKSDNACIPPFAVQMSQVL